MPFNGVVISLFMLPAKAARPRWWHKTTINGYYYSSSSSSSSSSLFPIPHAPFAIPHFPSSSYSLFPLPSSICLYLFLRLPSPLQSKRNKEGKGKRGEAIDRQGEMRERRREERGEKTKWEREELAADRRAASGRRSSERVVVRKEKFI